ncbi:protein rep, partial [Escherichia coli]|uniref:protein rep n=1 Tax=Escherichia coli TaxID=562 RepID=UPI0013C31343
MPEGASFAEVQRAALEAGGLETLKYTVISSEILRDPAWFLELARQTYGLRMIATGGRFREIVQDEKPETEEDL